MTIHNYAEMIHALYPIITEVKFQNEDSYWIETPFLDIRNDMIGFYLVQNSKGIFFSDDGETLNSTYLGFDNSKVCQKIMDKITNIPHISFTGYDIVGGMIDEENFLMTFISFIQAMILCSNIEYKELI